VKTKLLMGILLFAFVAQAREKPSYEKGKLLQMESVPCGYAENSGKGVGAVLLGTDSGHKKTQEMLCPEYLLQSDRIIYRIRPKEEKHPILLPVGETAEFRIHKDKLMLRVPEADAKEREYLVISMTPRADVKEAKPVSSSKRAPE